LGVGALSHLEFFITRLEESYFVQIRLSLTIGNALKVKYFSGVALRKQTFVMGVMANERSKIKLPK
jgi:hypothetical protein